MLQVKIQRSWEAAFIFAENDCDTTENGIFCWILLVGFFQLRETRCCLPNLSPLFCPIVNYPQDISHESYGLQKLKKNKTEDRKRRRDVDTRKTRQRRQTASRFVTPFPLRQMSALSAHRLRPHRKKQENLAEESRYYSTNKKKEKKRKHLVEISNTCDRGGKRTDAYWSSISGKETIEHWRQFYSRFSPHILTLSQVDKGKSWEKRSCMWHWSQNRFVMIQFKCLLTRSVWPTQWVDAMMNINICGLNERSFIVLPKESTSDLPMNETISSV